MFGTVVQIFSFATGQYGQVQQLLNRDVSVIPDSRWQVGCHPFHGLYVPENSATAGRVSLASNLLQSNLPTNTCLSKVEGLIDSVFDDMALSFTHKQARDRMNGQSSIVFLVQMLELDRYR